VPALRRLTTIALLALFATSLTPAFAAREPIDEAVAKAYVEDLGNKVLAVLNSPDLAKEERAREFTTLMLQEINFPQLSRRVLGRTYRKGTDAERADFTRYFAAYFIDTVIDLLEGLDVTGFQLGRFRSYPNKEVEVSAEVAKAEGVTIETDWRLSSDDGVVKVVDVIVENTSAAEHFRNLIARGTQSSNIKGNIDKLKELLKDSPTLAIVEQKL
jgi:ABC-type transporter MlaC component